MPADSTLSIISADSLRANMESPLPRSPNPPGAGMGRIKNKCKISLPCKDCDLGK